MKNSPHETLAEDMTHATNDEKVAALFDFMVRRGQTFYDESVTQLEHALQCANQARINDAKGTQVTSALLRSISCWTNIAPTHDLNHWARTFWSRFPDAARLHARKTLSVHDIRNTMTVYPKRQSEFTSSGHV